MGRKKLNKNDGNTDTLVLNNKIGISTPTIVTITKSKKYMVLRDKIRVSDLEFSDLNDPDLKAEFDFWTRTAKRANDNSKVEIVEV